MDTVLTHDDLFNIFINVYKYPKYINTNINEYNIML
jgi:hypothetical protein